MTNSVNDGVALTIPPDRLWNRNFKFLATGLLVSYVGDAFFAIGMIWLALAATGDALVAGTLMAIYALPSLFLGPFAGALVDTWNKRWIMIIGDGLRGLIVLVLYLLARFDTLPLSILYLAVVALSLCDTLYKPALRVLVPTLVPDKALPSANSFIQGSQQFATIIGSSLAGLVVVHLGTEATLLIDAGSFLISAGALWLVRFSAMLVQSRKVTAVGVLRNTWDGIRYIFSHANLLFVVLLAFGMNLVLSPVNVIFPLYSRDVIRAGAEGFGWLAAGIGAGLVLGNLLVGVIGARLRPEWSIFLGIVGMSLGFLGMRLAWALPPALVAVGLIGLAAPFVQIPVVTHIQRTVPSAMLGRIFATFGTLSTAAVPLGAALAGVALHSFASTALLNIAALGLLAVYALLYLYRRLVGSPMVADGSRGVEQSSSAGGR